MLERSTYFEMISNKIHLLHINNSVNNRSIKECRLHIYNIDVHVENFMKGQTVFLEG